MAGNMASAATVAAEQGTGKYLTFFLGNEEYGLEILRVREIIGMMHVTAVPRMPSYVKGVINLRGQIIPVIDLRLKFSMPEVAYTEETCIVVVEVNSAEMAIIVDRVSDVKNIADTAIDPAPSLLGGQENDFIQGLGKVDGKVTILLEIDQILTPGVMTGFGTSVAVGGDAAEDK